MSPWHIEVMACGSVACRPSENVRVLPESENQEARMIRVGQGESSRDPDKWLDFGSRAAVNSRAVFTLHKVSWQVGIKYDYVMLVKSCTWVQQHVFQEKAPMDYPVVGPWASPNQRMCLSPPCRG